MSVIAGLDVGSTTVKAVAIDVRSGEVLWQDYQRHEARQPERVLDFLRRMESEIGLTPGRDRLFLTGSGGSGLAPLVGAKYVQEVTAVCLAVETMHPDVNSIIELGGQDAKIVVFKEAREQNRKSKIPSMNDKCAGGTGAVIDKIAAKLRIPPDALGGYGYRGLSLHPVAGKCGVFAETDINGLQKRGVAREELMASLFDAIAQQNLTVLARGQTLRPVVMLLGGPNTFIRGMREAWQETIPRLWRERHVEVPANASLDDLIRVPPQAQYFGALGAVEFGRREDDTVGLYTGTRELERYLDVGRAELRHRLSQQALCASDAELRQFREVFVPQPFSPARFGPGEEVQGFVGIDGGSTSTKATLLGQDGRVLSKVYQLSNGNPIQDAIELIGRLQAGVESQRATLRVLGIGTTGYAKDILRDVLQADTALVETVAHTEAALAFFDDPHVVVDVGGQDIKLIQLRDGRITDFKLNTQCSAGNGYFLQSTAEQFGIPVQEYADVAFTAATMPRFGYGCAVFLQSDIVNFQRQGWRPSEILAGLASVLPQNVFLYVAAVANLAALGSRFILQGGTQNNLAVVKAEVDFIRSHFHAGDTLPEIFVHPHCGEAGALGAAFEAMRLHRSGRETTFIGLDALQQLTYESHRDETTRCHFCKNACLRTFIDVRAPDGTGRRLIVATCEKGAAPDEHSMRAVKSDLETVRAANPNLVEIAARDVWKPQRPAGVADPLPTARWPRRVPARRVLMERRGSLRVGVPRVLNLFAYAPLFSAYLESLGVKPGNIVYSDYTSEALYRAGAGRGAIDPCFPSKVAVSHVHNLLFVKHRQKPLDCIFFPMFDVLRSPLVNLCGMNACPTAAATPETVKAAFTRDQDLFAEHRIRYVSPLINLSDRKLFGRQMLGAWQSVLGVSAGENERAIEAGFAALDRYEHAIRARGREVIEQLAREHRIGIVVLGRPYHHDPGLNHGILDALQQLGYPILSQSTLPLDEDFLDPLFGEEVRAGAISHPLDITDVWKNAFSASTNHKIWAAKVTARHPNLVALELSSFKCGHDAPIYTLTRQIIERSGTPYFAFKDIDENNPAASIKIRVETIHYFLSRFREQLWPIALPGAAARESQYCVPPAPSEVGAGNPMTTYTSVDAAAP